MMRSIPAPKYDVLSVYELCVNSISDEDLKSRLSALSTDIVSSAQDYENKANSKSLYTIPPSTCKKHEIVLGTVTKKELMSVYSSHMVGSNKPARSVYDSLVQSEHLNGRCPFCAIGDATTLDHYLPKTKFPQLSVTPLNLVPACKDCNTGKSATIALTPEEQALHPYFDHAQFINEQWIFAEVRNTMPESVHYFVTPPANWDSISKQRVRAHFSDFNLSHRYSILAAEELSGRRHVLELFKNQFGVDFVISMLKEETVSHASVHINSWQTALYQALSHKYTEEATRAVGSIETCPRCSGKGKLLGVNCDICNGVGATTQTHLSSVASEIYKPVTCPNCLLGSLSCTLCNGAGALPLQKVKDLNL